MKKLFYQLAAAITFFTRLPLWRVVEIPAESFKKILYLWPLTGWITAATTALFWALFSTFLPVGLAIILTFATRVLLTGGLHEDGLADFFDGFGGGKTKADTLRIMKDTQVGSYALVGMIFYYLILFNLLILIPKELIPLVIIAADPLSKMMTTIMIHRLPYARTEEESKAKTLFEKMNSRQLITAIAFGLTPILLLLTIKLWLLLILPICTSLLLHWTIKKRIGGYTGDVCGASALICEVTVYLGLVIVLQL